jgi:hypothetical protein
VEGFTVAAAAAGFLAVMVAAGFAVVVVLEAVSFFSSSFFLFVNKLMFMIASCYY